MSVLSTIGKIIPPPTFLQLPSTGVDISDTSLKYIQFRPDQKIGTELKLLHWGNIEIGEGVLKRGSVNDIKKLSAAIKEMRTQTGTNFVRVSLPEEHAYLFETEIKKGTPLKEIRGLIEFKMQDDVPLSPQDAFFDYDIFDAGRSTNTLHVAVTAYAKEIVMSYYDACIEAGVTPLSFEVEAQAIARATIPKGDVGTRMIVDFGKTRTGIGIVHDSILMYTSTIDVGGGELSKALRAAVGDKPESELTEIKNQIGLVPEVNDTKVYDAMLPVMNQITDEIERRIQYWNNKDSNRQDRQIESIILCGGSINMKGLPGYLSEVLGIESKRAEVWQNAFTLNKTVPEIGRRYSYGYASAIGLALTHFN